MKKMVSLIGFLLPALFSFHPAAGWGQTGHRVVGEVASRHLTKKTRKALERIMEYESLAVAGTWMDEIRSDPGYDYMIDWHWVTIPDDKEYAETDINPNGDVIGSIERIIKELQNNRESMPVEKQREYIRMLTHLIGDLHQPLHVGNGKDKGGNSVRVVWFWNDSTNLHAVWDSKMIDSKQFSFTELAGVIDHPTSAEIKAWQSSSVREWAKESTSYRDEIYDLPDNGQLNYLYLYKNWDAVKLRLEQAGVRLAGVLNMIYG